MTLGYNWVMKSFCKISLLLAFFNDSSAVRIDALYE